MKPRLVSNFDPVGYGSATIRYDPVQNETKNNLTGILAHGWEIESVKSIEQVSRVEKRSFNFKVRTNRASYLLKQSNINDVQHQELINKAVQYLEDVGIIVPLIFPTKMGTTYQDSQKVYVLYSFLDGEYFDGSQKELTAVARNLPALEKALVEIPCATEIRQHQCDLIMHDAAFLPDLERRLDARKSRDSKINGNDGEREYEQYQKLREVWSLIKELSVFVQSASIEQLPFQIIHRDLNPHNLLFNRAQELWSFLDFDPMCYSQRIRDVGYALYRLSRTYGPRTERQYDVGMDINRRVEVFLSAYQEQDTLTQEEIRALPAIIIDDPLYQLIRSLKSHFVDGKPLVSLDKKICLVRDSALFLP